MVLREDPVWPVRILSHRGGSRKNTVLHGERPTSCSLPCHEEIMNFILVRKQEVVCSGASSSSWAGVGSSACVDFLNIRIYEDPNKYSRRGVSVMHGKADKNRECFVVVVSSL